MAIEFAPTNWDDVIAQAKDFFESPEQMYAEILAMFGDLLSEEEQQLICEKLGI